MIRIIFTIILVHLVSNLPAQEMYFNSKTDLYKVNLNSCNVEQLYEIDNFLDIAIAPDGQIYGVTENKIFQIDSMGSQLIHTIEQDSAFVNDYFNGLTVSPSGVLYTVNTRSDLYAYDPVSKEQDSIGWFNSFSSGDITFLNGDIWLASGSDRLIRMNLETFETELLVDTFFQGGSHGLTTLINQCNSQKAILFQGTSHKTSIYEFDESSGSFNPLCEFGSIGINGSASEYEFLGFYDSIQPLSIKEVKLDTPTCDINNGRLIITLAGNYEDINYSIYLNGNLEESLNIADVQQGINFIKVINELGCSDSLSLDIPCILNTITKNIDPAEPTIIYPNPFCAELKIKAPSPLNSLQIFNIKGNVVFKQDEIRKKKLEINLANFKDGVYIVKVGNKAWKVVKDSR